MGLKLPQSVRVFARIKTVYKYTSLDYLKAGVCISDGTGTLQLGC